VYLLSLQLVDLGFEYWYLYNDLAGVTLDVVTAVNARVVCSTLTY